MSASSQHPIPASPLIFQCPLCKSLTTLQTFTTSVEGITITCPACSQRFFCPTPSASMTVSSGKSSAKHEPPAHASSKGKSAAKEKKETSTKATSVASVDSGVAQESATPNLAVEAKTPTTQPKSTDSRQRRCPKCSQRLDDDAKDCPKCGLHLANVGVTFDPTRFEKAQNVLEEKAISLWDNVQQNWDDDSAHERFVQYCISQNLLELATYRYRKIKDEEDQREETATRQLARIVELVQQQFLVQQKGNGSMEQTIQRGRWVLMLVLLVFGVLAFYIIWRAMSGSAMQIQIP